MKEVKLSCGLNANVDVDAMDDLDFIEALGNLEDGNITAVPKILVTMLGKDQYESLKKHIKKEKGKASLTFISEVIT